jgi:hypothetical protein
MANLVSIGEAQKHSSYSYAHLLYLAKEGKVSGRKSGNVWLIDLDSLVAYEQRMKDLGTQKHDPRRGNLEV